MQFFTNHYKLIIKAALWGCLFFMLTVSFPIFALIITPMKLFLLPEHITESDLFMKLIRCEDWICYPPFDLIGLIVNIVLSVAIALFFSFIITRLKNNILMQNDKFN